MRGGSTEDTGAYWTLGVCCQARNPASTASSGTSGTKDAYGAYGVPYGDTYRYYTTGLTKGTAGRTENYGDPYGDLLRRCPTERGINQLVQVFNGTIHRWPLDHESPLFIVRHRGMAPPTGSPENGGGAHHYGWEGTVDKKPPV